MAFQHANRRVSVIAACGLYGLVIHAAILSVRGQIPGGENGSRLFKKGEQAATDHAESPREASADQSTSSAESPSDKPSDVSQAAPPIATPPTTETPAASDAGKAGSELQQQPAKDSAPASSFAKREYKPDPDPFGTESIKAGDNVVRLLKSEKDRAWIIRFDKNPNDGRAKDDPHPVLAFLKKEAGYRWGFSDADGKGGWGKVWNGDQYHTEHLDAQAILRHCAKLIDKKRCQDPF